MFIIKTIEKEKHSNEVKKMLKIIERYLGFLPPHYELFATLNPQFLQEFLEFNNYMITHKRVDGNLLPYLRLYISKQECRSYCDDFNTKLLLKNGADKKLLKNIVQNLQNIPFDDKQKILLRKVLKALYEAEHFNENDLDALYKIGFSDQDFFDLLSYGANFMSKSKLIDVYLK